MASSTTPRAALLRWFDRHRRALPWRETTDPYAIWVSEVMLQQTQVVKVVPYYLRFLERFPTVKALAKAPEADVLAAWSGLGYYARARNLQKAAKAVVAEHGGKLPPTVEALLELPGFGRYTAGAVASIAFGVAAPIVDGNVARVLSRVFAIEGAPGLPKREKALWAHAEKLVKGPRPGDFNQALMELGATVCTPTKPLCLLCPLHAFCEARKQGRVEQLPPPKVRAARKVLRQAVAVCRRRSSLLLARRKPGGLFGGLWELPSVETGAKLEAEALLELLGSGAWVGAALGTVQRTLTHRDLELSLREASVGPTLKTLDGYVEIAWFTPADATKLGVSSATRAVLAQLGW